METIFTNKDKLSIQNIREFECVIRIGHFESDPRKIKKELSDSLAEKYHDNNIEYIINARLQKHFSTKCQKVYLTNYKEKSGSLILQFTILIFNTIQNYNDINSGIENFLNDISDFIDTILHEQYNIEHQSVETTTFRMANNTQYKKWKIAMMPILIFISLGVSIFSFFESQKENEIHSLVIEELEKYKEQEKINEAYNYYLFQKYSSMLDKKEILIKADTIK